MVVAIMALALAAAPRTVQMIDVHGEPAGRVFLRQTPNGLLIEGALHGLPPGEHGFHVHERGVCEPPFTSAGGHFNPLRRQHGFVTPHGAHAGDLPNIVAGGDGSAAFDFIALSLRLAGDITALDDGDGSALIVHAGPDDYATDPSGGAGDRIACGVVPPG